MNYKQVLLKCDLIYERSIVVLTLLQNVCVLAPHTLRWSVVVGPSLRFRYNQNCNICMDSSCIFIFDLVGYLHVLRTCAPNQAQDVS